jgi:two-component system, OmpR family, alkaline phosphatase synthesis response regulator PhoP
MDVDDNPTAKEPKLTVLVVDDNRQLIEFLTDALEELGNFAVVTATDGAQGLERYYDVRPDCVVVDVRMPGIDGYQLVRALRGDPDSSSTSLIILSALVQDKEQVAGLLAGADLYLVKPVDPLELIQAIQRVLQQSEGLRRQHQQALLDDPSLHW